jgi:hypothetical protein
MSGWLSVKCWSCPCHNKELGIRSDEGLNENPENHLFANCGV